MSTAALALGPLQIATEASSFSPVRSISCLCTAEAWERVRKVELDIPKQIMLCTGAADLSKGNSQYSCTTRVRRGREEGVGEAGLLCVLNMDQ
jgi:hypothetical protein